MNKQEKLISLLQPKDYKSKIKLYCRDCKIEKLCNKFGSLEIKPYICRIKIIENEK